MNRKFHFRSWLKRCWEFATGKRRRPGKTIVKRSPPPSFQFRPEVQHLEDRIGGTSVDPISAFTSSAVVATLAIGAYEIYSYCPSGMGGYQRSTDSEVQLTPPTGTIAGIKGEFSAQDLIQSTNVHPPNVLEKAFANYFGNTDNDQAEALILAADKSAGRENDEFASGSSVDSNRDASDSELLDSPLLAKTGFEMIMKLADAEMIEQLQRFLTSKFSLASMKGPK